MNFNILFTLNRVTSAALLAGGAMAAHADVGLSLPGSQYGLNYVNVTTSGTSPGSYGGLAGAFAGSLSGAGVFDAPSFVTYCVELEQEFSFSGSLSGWNVVAPGAYNGGHPNGWGASSVAIGNRLGQLLTYALPVVANGADSTSLQLAIWNTIYDTDNTLGAHAGAIFTDTSGFASKADQYLANSQATVRTLKVGILSNGGAQDFIATAPVPEPETYAMMSAGLMGLGFLARRRSRRS